MCKPGVVGLLLQGEKHIARGLEAHIALLGLFGTGHMRPNKVLTPGQGAAKKHLFVSPRLLRWSDMPLESTLLGLVSRPQDMQETAGRAAVAGRKIDAGEFQHSPSRTLNLQKRAHA